MQTIWLSPTDYVTGDPSLRISYPSISHPDTIVTSKTKGDLKWVSMGLRLPENTSIEEVIICYQVSNPLSFISQVRLVEMDIPDHGLVIHDDGTDLKSTEPVCYSSQVGGKVPTPGKAVTLALRLNFNDTKDQIGLGAVGLKLQSTAELCVNVKDFGAIGDGRPHPLTQRYTTLAEAQADYPTVASLALNDEIDGVAIQAAIDSLPSGGTEGSGGGIVCFPPGEFQINRQIDIPHVGVTLAGAGAFTTVLRPLAPFTGETLIQFRPPSGGQISRAIVMRDFHIHMDGVKAHGVTLVRGYDNVWFHNLYTDGVADAYNAYRFTPDPDIAHKVSQTLLLTNVLGIHAAATATCPTFYFESCNETVLISCKGWGGTKEGATANPFCFVDCRGVVLLGCSAALSCDAGIKITSERAGTSGVLIDGCTFEKLGKLLTASGTKDTPVKWVRLRNLRVQDVVGPIELDHVTLGDIESDSLPVKVGAGCSQVHIVTNDPRQITDDGTNTTILGWRNAIDNEPTLYPGLTVEAPDSPRYRWRVKGNRNSWEFVGSANEAGDLGLHLRYRSVATTRNAIHISPAGDTLSLYAHGSEALKVTEPIGEGETALLIQRKMDGSVSLQRVSVGAPDSGGTGFRVLRVPN